MGKIRIPSSLIEYSNLPEESNTIERDKENSKKIYEQRIYRMTAKAKNRKARLRKRML